GTGGAAPGGEADVGPCLFGGPGGLPEDGLAAAPDAGEDDLAPVLPRPVQDEVDGGASPDAGAHRHALDDLDLVGPFGLRVAEDLGRSWPAVARLQHHPAGP